MSIFPFGKEERYAAKKIGFDGKVEFKSIPIAPFFLWGRRSLPVGIGKTGGSDG